MPLTLLLIEFLFVIFSIAIFFVGYGFGMRKCVAKIDEERRFMKNFEDLYYSAQDTIQTDLPEPQVEEFKLKVVKNKDKDNEAEQMKKNRFYM